MTLYNFKDKKKQTLEVRDDIFGIHPHQDVITQTVQYHLIKQRTGLAHTKTRGEVRGGGRKPWRQKGTGRARHGSIRSPLWKGGGVVFGPRKRTITRRLPKKMRRLAIKSLLSARMAEGKLWAYEALELTAPKSKEMAKLLQQLPAAKRVMIVSDKKDDLLKLATQNIPVVRLLEGSFPSVLELISSDFVLLHKDIVKKIEELYGREAKSTLIKKDVEKENLAKVVTEKETVAKPSVTEEKSEKKNKEVRKSKAVKPKVKMSPKE